MKFMLLQAQVAQVATKILFTQTIYTEVCTPILSNLGINKCLSITFFIIIGRGFRLTPDGAIYLLLQKESHL